MKNQLTDNPVPQPAVPLRRRIKAVTVGSIESWFGDRAASKGAALAFYTIFSLTPLLVIVIAIAGAFLGEKAATGALFDQLHGLLGPRGAEAVQMLLLNASNKEAGLVSSAIAAFILLLGATTAFGELKYSLDEIWHVPPEPRSAIIVVLRTRLLSVGLILVLVFLLLVSLTVNAALEMLKKYATGRWAELAFILDPLSSGFSFLTVACLFAAIYKLLPRIALSWSDVVIGSLSTAALFFLGKSLIGAYLGHSGITNSFGAAGSLIALLLWVYYSAQIFFLGAVLTRHYALWFGSLRNSPAHDRGRSATQAAAEPGAIGPGDKT